MSRKLELASTILGDLVFLSAAFFASWQTSEINTPITSGNAIAGNIILLLIWFFLFQSSDLYISRFKIQLMDDLFRLLRALFIGMIIIAGLGYLIHIDFIKAPGFIPTYVILLTFFVMWRLFWRGLIGQYLRKRQEKVIIFKNGDVSEDYGGFNIVKKIKIDEFHVSDPIEIFKKNNIDGIVIESNGKPRAETLNIISRFAEKNYEIYVTPKLYPLVYQYFLVSKVPDSNLLRVIFHPLSTWDQFLKRLIDILLGSISLVVLSPIMLLITFFIKLDGPGPVFYKQKRVGYRGTEFVLYKFRSMVSDAEKLTGPIWAVKNDTRITRVGRILRPFRLDELPQLFNVLSGDMSFVGPRPERPHFVKNLKDQIPLYILRLTVHPGVTGLAQVKHSYDRSIEDVKKKLEYDLQYINNMSLRLDLKIFLKTIITVLSRAGAH